MIPIVKVNFSQCKALWQESNNIFVKETDTKYIIHFYNDHVPILCEVDKLEDPIADMQWLLSWLSRRNVFKNVDFLSELPVMAEEEPVDVMEEESDIEDGVTE